MKTLATVLLFAALGMAGSPCNCGKVCGAHKHPCKAAHCVTRDAHHGRTAKKLHGATVARSRPVFVEAIFYGVAGEGGKYDERGPR